jgi:hypothetical protein
MRASVDCHLAGIQPVTPSAQRMRRQLHRSGVGADAHSAPIHRLYMHRPERLHGTIAGVCAAGKPSLLLLSQRFCPLFPALLTTQFRLIFCELTCSVFADELLQPTPKYVLGEMLLMTVFADPQPASAPCIDVHRPPFTSCLVLEVFRSHRRFSTAAESPRWNANVRSESSATAGRLQGDSRRQDKSVSPVER